MLSNFEYIGDTVNLLNCHDRKIYKYCGTGYFPEVVERLRNTVNITYIDRKNKIIHIEEEEMNETRP